MYYEIRNFSFFLYFAYFFVFLQPKDYKRYDKLRPHKNLHHHV